jgi:alpha,alpha-trehalase
MIASARPPSALPSYLGRALLTLTAFATLATAVLPATCRAQSPTSQSATQQGVPSKPQGTVTVDQYIHQAWATLSRSMTDCSSLIDPKTTTRPVLYVPAELPIPPQVAALKSACGVRAEHLPKRIDHPGALMPSEIATPGLLYLPNKYVVPGGRFNEMYGWDSYFIILGLLEDEHRDLAKGMVENFFFEIEHYGSLLNANRTYYLTRSQPPLLSSMIRDVYDADTSARPEGYRQDDAWLARAYGFAKTDHDFWLQPGHRAGTTGLARYHDLGVGPVPEMADDSTYYPDIIRWLLAHPEVKTSYLVDGPDLPAASSGPNVDAASLANLAKVSCDTRLSGVCAHAHVGTHWLSRDFYEGDRAMRESGFDPSFRFGAFSGSTENYAPVCLNALLYKYELDLAWMATKLGKNSDASAWNKQAAARKSAIDKYLWNPARGLYFDYDYTTASQSHYVYISTLYPLWAGAADHSQAKAVVANAHLLTHPGGIAMSANDSGLQWDLPYGWAPTTWFAVAGMVNVGALDQARTVAAAFMHTVDDGYRTDGTLREKYNVVTGSANVEVATGYKTNVVGFGWTNSVYLRFKRLLASPPADAKQVVQ